MLHPHLPSASVLSVNQAVRRRLGAAAHTADSRGPTGPIATHPSKAQFCPCPRPDSDPSMVPNVLRGREEVIWSFLILHASTTLAFFSVFRLAKAGTLARCFKGCNW